MKIKNYKCKCGFDEFVFAYKGTQVGIYCDKCGKWLKWADKDERNLALKADKSTLNEIRADLEEKIRLLNTGGTEEKADCLGTIDKIRAEMERAMSDAQDSSRDTQDDIDCGICVGLQRALNIIDKYKEDKR